MLSYSFTLVLTLAFITRERIAEAKPLGLINPFSDFISEESNDENDNEQSRAIRYRKTKKFSTLTYFESPYVRKRQDVIPQNFEKLTYFKSPFDRTKRDVNIDWLPSNDEFSMVSSAPTDGPTVRSSEEPSRAPTNLPSEAPSPVESVEPSSMESEPPSDSPSEDPTSLSTTSFPTAFNFTDGDFDDDFEDDFFNFTEVPSANFTDDDFEEFFNSTEIPSANPSSAPSASIDPSSSPTLEDCLISEAERRAQILALLDAVGNATAIRDLDTSQGLATEWLMEQDFRKECPSEKIVQRWVIALFYFSTDGESWSKCSAAGSDPCGSEFPFDGARRFLSDFSECEWAGITCNEDDCVTEIEFEENNLIGTIPTELGLLKELAVLGMERGGLSSTIPSEIGLLTNLVFVDLDFNELTGSLPTELYLLTKLETLDLNDNLLEGNIDSIGVFENMEFLQLQRNLFTGTIPEEIGNMAMMTIFYLHENMFTGIIPGSICDLRDTNGGLLKSLIADCANSTSTMGPEIECDCCSSCRGN